MCRFEVLYLLSLQLFDGRREGGGLRALDKVVNSLYCETLVLLLLLMLTLRRTRSLRSRRGVELRWSWSCARAELRWSSNRVDRALGKVGVAPEVLNECNGLITTIVTAIG